MSTDFVIAVEQPLDELIAAERCNVRVAVSDMNDAAIDLPLQVEAVAVCATQCQSDAVQFDLRFFDGRCHQRVDIFDNEGHDSVSVNDVSIVP